MVAGVFQGRGPAIAHVAVRVSQIGFRMFWMFRDTEFAAVVFSAIGIFCECYILYIVLQFTQLMRRLSARGAFRAFVSLRGPHSGRGLRAPDPVGVHPPMLCASLLVCADIHELKAVDAVTQKWLLF